MKSLITIREVSTAEELKQAQEIRVRVLEEEQRVSARDQHRRCGSIGLPRARTRCRGASGYREAYDGGRRSQNTALLITDPQNDFLSPEGATWDLVGESVTENGTVENIEALFRAAKENEIQVFISPHYYFPTDHGWKFEGTLEKVMHDIHMFDRKGALNLDDFEGSGADWLERYKPYIDDGQTVVASPHKVYGPENNDLVLQLRKRGIGRVVLGGMSANLCVEAHMRELLEQGFEVMVVKDATAAAVTPDLGDGYTAGVTNFKFMANAVVTTEEAVEAMEQSGDASEAVGAD